VKEGSGICAAVGQQVGGGQLPARCTELRAGSPLMAARCQRGAAGLRSGASNFRRRNYSDPIMPVCSQPARARRRALLHALARGTRHPGCWRRMHAQAQQACSAARAKTCTQASAHNAGARPGRDERSKMSSWTGNSRRMNDHDPVMRVSLSPPTGSPAPQAPLRREAPATRNCREGQAPRLPADLLRASAQATRAASQPHPPARTPRCPWPGRWRSSRPCRRALPPPPPAQRRCVMRLHARCVRACLTLRMHAPAPARRRTRAHPVIAPPQQKGVRGFDSSSAADVLAPA
jgi:hypothetical protein